MFMINGPGFNAGAGKVGGPRLTCQTGCSKRSPLGDLRESNTKSRPQSTRLRLALLHLLALAFSAGSLFARNHDLPFVSPMFGDHTVLQRGNPTLFSAAGLPAVPFLTDAPR